MKVSPDVLAARLEAVLGPGAVLREERALRPYIVDGKPARIYCAPSDPDQGTTAVRICAEAEAAITPWGGGTWMRLGNVPRRVDVVIGLARLNRLIEHDDSNLTATVQAGMTVASLQEILGRRTQFLAIDPPHPDRATIGGMVAANTNGPRRMLYGGVRDLVIGMKMVLATGEAIKAGGKVVKNVAGYDMCKLFVGSLGTLGIITEVTFKMSPVPETVATIVARGPLAQGAQLVEELFQSTLLPASIAILSADVASSAGLPAGMPAVAVWAEGFEEAVQRHLTDVRTMAERNGLTPEVLRDGPHRRLWEHVRDFGVDPSTSLGAGLLYRMTVPLASVAEVVAAIERWNAGGRAARFIAHAGTGTVWVSLDDEWSGAEWFSRLMAMAQEHRGHVVMVAAPPALKDGVDVWGPPPASLSVMREIKRQFDPQGILNPGRFVAWL